MVRQEFPCSRSDCLADAAGPEGDDRQTRRHRLEHDIAECLGQARESEDVGCRVVVRQVFPLAISGEMGERTDPPLQSRSCRPVADQQDPYIGPPRRDDRQGIQRGNRRSFPARFGSRSVITTSSGDHPSARRTSRSPGPSLAETASCRPRASTAPAARSQGPRARRSLSPTGRTFPAYGYETTASIARSLLGPTDPVMVAVLIELCESSTRPRDGGATLAGARSSQASPRWRCG